MFWNKQVGGPCVVINMIIIGLHPGLSDKVDKPRCSEAGNKNVQINSK